MWRAAGHDGVVSTQQVVGRGIVLVARFFVLASGTGVCRILAKAVTPAIIHCRMTIGENGACGNSGCKRGIGGGSCSNDSWWGDESSGIVCPMKTGSLRGKDAHAFLVFHGEVLCEVGQCMVSSWFATPDGEGIGEDAGLFQYSKDKANGGSIRNGFLSAVA